MKPKNKALNAWIKDNRSVDLLSPGIPKKSDKELKTEMFHKMIGKYIDIALKEQHRQIINFFCTETDKLIECSKDCPEFTGCTIKVARRKFENEAKS